MIFEPKEITLKNGKTAIFKSPSIEDAEQLLNYIKTASGETDFLTRYPEEWTTTVEQEAKWIQNSLDDEDMFTFACYIDGKVVGNCEIRFYKGIKTSHRGLVGIAILKDYWNLGIGSAMFEELIAASKERGILIMELEFIEGNDRARHLYEKFGFKIVSEKPNAFRLKDGTMLSEFYMQKYL